MSLPLKGYETTHDRWWVGTSADKEMIKKTDLSTFKMLQCYVPRQKVNSYFTLYRQEWWKTLVTIFLYVMRYICYILLVCDRWNIRSLSLLEFLNTCKFLRLYISIWCLWEIRFLKRQNLSISNLHVLCVVWIESIHWMVLIVNDSLQDEVIKTVSRIPMSSE